VILPTRVKGANAVSLFPTACTGVISAKAKTKVSIKGRSHFIGDSWVLRLTIYDGDQSKKIRKKTDV
jgi:hypothetical protein